MQRCVCFARHAKYTRTPPHPHRFLCELLVCCLIADSCVTATWCVVLYLVLTAIVFSCLRCGITMHASKQDIYLLSEPFVEEFSVIFLANY